MKYAYAAVAETIEIVKRSQYLLLLYIGFAFLPLIANSTATPPIFDLALMFVSLGWFAARWIYVDRTYRNKPLNIVWYKLWESVVKAGLRLLPLVLLLVGLVLLPVLGIALWYGRWFAGSYLNSGLGLTTAQVMQQFVPALFNPLLWQEFFTQNILMTFVYQTFQLSVMVGLLLTKVAVILLIMEKFSVWESIVRAVYYLQEHAYMIASFVILSVFANGIGKVMLLLLSLTVGQISGLLESVLAVMITAGLVYVLDIFVFAYYSKSDTRNVFQKKIMRWWRKSHN